MALRTPRASILLAVAAGLLLAPAPAAAQGSPAARETAVLSPRPGTAYLATPEELLQLELDRLLRGSAGERATVGAEVRSIARGDLLYSLNAERLLQPASNVKLFTVAGALHYLGPDFAFRTSLYATGAPGPDGVLQGDLVIEGRGDPNLSGRFYADSVTYVLDRLAATLAEQGVRIVAGDLVGENGYFDGPEMGEGWPWDTQQWGYSAQIDALSFNDNTVVITALPGPAPGVAARIRKSPETGYVTVLNEVRTGRRRGGRSLRVRRDPESNTVRITGEVPLASRGASVVVAVDDPARFTLAVFRERLARAGVEVEGRTRLADERDRAGRGRWRRLAVHVSPPLRETVKVINKRSQNFYAEQLLKTIGAEVRGRGASAAGIAALDDFLRREVGIEPGEVYLADGSGLSRLNLVTPRAVVRLLTHMARHPHARDFYESLVVPGEDRWSGRLNEPLTRGNLHAKTGTVRYVSAYSGYVTAANGERLAFSILLNNRPEGKASAVELENAAVRALARFSR